jgi:hypothetical protein
MWFGAFSVTYGLNISHVSGNTSHLRRKFHVDKSKGTVIMEFFYAQVLVNYECNLEGFTVNKEM